MSLPLQLKVLHFAMTPMSLHRCILMQVRAKRKTITKPLNSDFGISTSPYAANLILSPAQIMLCIPQLPSELTWFTRTVCPLQERAQWCMELFGNFPARTYFSETRSVHEMRSFCGKTGSHPSVHCALLSLKHGCKQTRPLGSVCYLYSCLPMSWY